jgi:putative ABC transport system permease protein
MATGWALAAQAFQFEYQPRWETLALGAVAGALIAMLTGWVGLRGVLRAPPLASLRQA